MTTPDIDYAQLFAAQPKPSLVLDRDLVIVAVNPAYLEASGQRWEDVVGRSAPEAFPTVESRPEAVGAQKLDTALLRVLATGEPDNLGMRRFDAPDPEAPEESTERWWSGEAIPVRGPDGAVAWILLLVEDLSEFVQSLRSRRGRGVAAAERPGEAEADLYARAEELQRLNAELRRANIEERQVALRLQESMLYSPDLAHHPSIAVRYLPAAGTLDICGDWYDVTDVSPGRYAVAVGDVVGHGLEAAAVMGMLRSALGAVMRVGVGPGQALAILGVYAGAVEGGLAATAVKLLIDSEQRRITYSSAGHLPPILLRPDDSHQLLDQATDPPLATRPETEPRLEAELPYASGDTLVLYTDGLVERRGEDIDTGIARLVDALGGGCELGAEQLADTLLSRIGIDKGGADDVALVVVRL